ncbi:DUF7604 domain-containing protein [Bifidobacterium moukalabense]|uniref:DUF7604 domain-containing protein n=1 Tax=Bifidobacterium moukalabense TaxID=1333651 RepID=UPI001F281A33|nr:FctA domain-containing protein [Bifidobacterium moukalabense]
MAKRIIAAIAAVAMLGGVGYATATTAVAEEEAGTLATESFMGTTVGREWILLNDACLTAGGTQGCTAKRKANGDSGIYNQSNGLLQLTGDVNDATGGAVFNHQLDTSLGLDVTFYQYQTARSSGADGIGFFLADGNQELTTTGASGAGLGYANTRGGSAPSDGLSEGVLGLGLDVYGNFANDTDWVGGTDCTQYRSGQISNSVVLRGAGNGSTGYCKVTDAKTYTGLTTSKAPLVGSSYTDGADGVKVRIIISPQKTSADGTVTEYSKVTVIVGDTTIYNNVELNYALPATVKMGFSASTGGSKQPHYIRGVQVKTVEASNGIMLSKYHDTKSKQYKVAYAEGDKVPYSFLITNSGTQNLSTVTLTDTNADEGSLTCTPSLPAATLAPTATIQCTATHTLTEAEAAQGSFTNEASASGVASGSTLTAKDSATVPTIKPLAAPDHTKWIVKDASSEGDGDQYTLNLNVTGNNSETSIASATPADVILVMDKSGSMEGSRDTNSQTAANALAKKLLTTANSSLDPSLQAQMAVVTFSDKATVKLDGKFTTSADAIASAITDTPNGGTNWEDALKKANGLSSGRAGVKKYIIFLSDGNPTFRVTSYGGCFHHNQYDSKYTTQEACEAASSRRDTYSWKTNPDDKRSDGVHGHGDSDEYGFNYAAALAEANNRGKAALYVVKTSNDANKMTNLASDAKAVTGKELDGTTATNLTNAFEQIYSSITSTSKVKVYSITDTLTQWVDPVDLTDGDVTDKVTVTAPQGKATPSYTATYVESTRTLTVKFTDGVEAGAADTYGVSFKVKPSAQAYADYATNGQTYPDVADDGTSDKSETVTNDEGKHIGYYSNTAAKLTYCIVTTVGNQESACTEKTVDYGKPVVNVKLGKITITKQWSDGNGKHANDSVTVQLQRTATGVEGATAESVGNELTLNAENKWTAEVDNLQPGYTYSVVETSGNDRYDVTYSDGQDLTEQMVWSSSDDAGTLNATVTNTLKQVTLENLVSVKKNLAGRAWTATDKFDFTLEATDGAPLPEVCQNQQSCEVSVKSDSASYAAAFGNITYDAGEAEYTYNVTENKGSASAMHYSKAKYEVVVTVAKSTDGEWNASVSSVTKVLDDNGNSASEKQDVSDPVTFTNHYIQVSVLPFTGGTTDRQWLLVGGGIAGMAALMIGAAGIWRGKKRLV